MKRQKSIIFLMLALIHTCALSLDGEYSNGQISMERKQLIKEYSLMRASLVYIARSIDSFFIENKVPSVYKKILFSIQRQLLLLHKDSPMQQERVVSSFLQNDGGSLTDYRDVLILPVQASQSDERGSHEHGSQFCRGLDPPWNVPDVTHSNIHEMSSVAQDDLFESQQSNLSVADTVFFDQGEYAGYELQKVDLFAELQQIYDSFDLEFNELALLAVQDQPFDFDLTECLFSSEEIESIQTHVDWSTNVCSFVTDPDVHTEVMFIDKKELEDVFEQGIAEKGVVQRVIEFPGAIILDPIESIAQESVALLDQLVTPVKTMRAHQECIQLHKVQDRIQLPLLVKAVDVCGALISEKKTKLVASSIDPNLEKNAHEIAVLKALIDKLQKQISDNADTIHTLQVSTDEWYKCASKPTDSKSVLQVSTWPSGCKQIEHSAIVQQVPIAVAKADSVKLHKKKQSRNNVELLKTIEPGTVQLARDQELILIDIEKSPAANLKDAIEREQFIEQTKYYPVDKKSNWLQTKVKQKLDIMLKKLKARPDFGEFGMQTVLELVDLEMEIIDYLLAGDRGIKAENAIDTRDKVLKRSPPSVKWVYGRIVDVASTFAIKLTKMREHVKEKGVALSKALSKDEKKLFLQRMQQVLASYYAIIRNMQRSMLLN